MKKFIKKLKNKIEARYWHRQRLAMRKQQYELAKIHNEKIKKLSQHRVKLQQVALVSHSGGSAKNYKYITIELNELAIWLIKQNKGMEKIVQQGLCEIVTDKYNDIIKEMKLKDNLIQVTIEELKTTEVLKAKNSDEMRVIIERIIEFVKTNI